MHNTVAADFFTVEVVTPYALVTFYVLLFPDGLSNSGDIERRDPPVGGSASAAS